MITKTLFIDHDHLYKNQLIIPSGFYDYNKDEFSSYQRDGLQVFDLTNNTMKSYLNVIDYGGCRYGLLYPGSYLTATKMVIFGGKTALSDCIQQTGELDNIESKWSCLAYENTTWEGILWDEDSSRYVFSQSINESMISSSNPNTLHVFWFILSCFYL